MHHSKQIDLLAQCLELTTQKAQYNADEEARVPVDKYTDPQRFEVEHATIFRRGMGVVAHGSELPNPGDFVTRDLLGTPVIVVRGHDGRVRTFINVCRHRGATLELREQGHCRRFVCPYHAWAYETDGRLTVIRQPEGFPTLDPSEIKLAELSCFEAAQMIWACPELGFGTSAPDDDTRLVTDEISGLLAGPSVVFAKSSRVWKANWKILVDGGLESYHFRIAHRKTIGDAFPDNTSTFEFVGDHVRTVLPKRSIQALADQPRDDWRIRDHTHLVYTLRSNAMILMQKGHYELLLLTPLSADETRIDMMTVVPDPGPEGHTDKSKTYWAKNHAFTKQTLDEDFIIGEQIQRGLRTGANSFFRFARYEAALKRWHQQLETAIAPAIAASRTAAGYPMSEEA